jgi:hypothetical protein
MLILRFNAVVRDVWCQHVKTTISSKVHRLWPWRFEAGLWGFVLRLLFGG